MLGKGDLPAIAVGEKRSEPYDTRIDSFILIDGRILSTITKHPTCDIKTCKEPGE